MIDTVTAVSLPRLQLGKSSFQQSHVLLSEPTTQIETRLEFRIF